MPFLHASSQLRGFPSKHISRLLAGIKSRCVVVSTSLVALARGFSRQSSISNRHLLSSLGRWLRLWTGLLDVCANLTHNSHESGHVVATSLHAWDGGQTNMMRQYQLQGTQGAKERAPALRAPGRRLARTDKPNRMNNRLGNPTATPPHDILSRAPPTTRNPNCPESFLTREPSGGATA